MAAVLADTHAILWYLTGDTRLSRAATTALDGATAAGDPIYVSVISVIEIQYLVERGRLSSDDRRIVHQALDDPHSPTVLLPVHRSIAEAVALVDRDQVADLPDRIIAASALALGVPLLSRDRKIRAANVPTIW